MKKVDIDNRWDRTHKFEEHILKNIGGWVYLDCCSLDIDPIEIYKKKKWLEEDQGKKILCIVGNNTEFGYLVTYVLADQVEGGELETDIDNLLGESAFAYVQNVQDDYSSEYGYVVVDKLNGRYVRVH